MFAQLLLGIGLLSLPGSDEPAACDITIDFGSYASGIDRQAEARVRDWLSENPDVSSTRVGDYGREGEYTLCLNTGSTERTNQVFVELTRLVPKNNERAPTRITRAGS